MSQETTFADLVRTGRESRGMSQSVLAKACGVSERTVIRVERGAQASPETVQALCSVLGISPTGAHAALSARASKDESYGAIRILPQAYGDETGRERDLAVRRVLRENPDALIVTASDAARIAAKDYPEEVTRSLAPSYEGGVPVDERRLRALMRLRRSWAEKAYDAISRYTDDGGALIASMLAFCAGMVGVGVLFFALLASSQGEQAAFEIGMLACALFTLACGSFVVRNSGRHSRIESVLFKAGRVLAVFPDRLAFGWASELRTVDVMDLKDVVVERDGDGHVTLRIVTRRGVKFDFESLPADVRLVQALERVRMGSLASSVFPQDARVAYA